VLAFLRTHPNLACVPVDLQVAQEAAHLRADKKFAPPDALIIGTGLATQVRHLVTNDHSWSRKLAAMSSRIAVVETSSHLPFP
jgi:predicted nucleic acid-binding protein